MSVSPSGDAALGYASRGWPVFPVRPRGKVPLTAHGFHDASRDPDTIRAWWEHVPRANVGVACGDALTVIDVDGDEGSVTWRNLVGRYGWPDAPTVRTGRGFHVYYATPPGRVRSRARVAPGIDVRSHGGYVVAPPSVHESGVRYAWTGALGVALPPLPVELRRMLREHGPAPMPRPQHVAAPSRVNAYAAAVLDGECAAVASTPEGARNDRLVRAAFRVGRFVTGVGLDAEYAVGRLVDAALRAGLHEREARATIGSGLAAGAAYPWERAG